MVNSQLNILTPVGTAMAMLVEEKGINAALAPMVKK
jgi:hypothetical protein